MRIPIDKTLNHFSMLLESLKLCKHGLKLFSSFYRFTKGLTQNLNLRTNLKLEYNVKSLNYIQQNFRFKASFLFC